MNHDLFVKPAGVRTRWSSFENPHGLKNAGAAENQGAKGHPCDILEPGASHVLAHYDGAGIVRRIWMTISDRSPQMLRGLRIEMFWDGAPRPAVSSPLGDFFGIGMGRRAPFDSEFFSDPEGRSFVCHIPMPFRSGARIVLTNETPQRLNHLFYDINVELHDHLDPAAMYLHAHWRRENPTSLGVDYTVLPAVRGRGRFLGAVFGVRPNPGYRSWWGEGEVKIYLDGDDRSERPLPTLVGTGTEDYISDAWGLKPFAQRYTGCPIVGPDATSFYRWHVTDPVWFDEECRVTMQQIGCEVAGAKARLLLESGLPVRLTLWDRQNVGGRAHRLLDEPETLAAALGTVPAPALASGAAANLAGKAPAVADFGDGAVHYYRVDDWSSCAYFYLDRPDGTLPPLAPLAERVADLTEVAGARDRADI